MARRLGNSARRQRVGQRRHGPGDLAAALRRAGGRCGSGGCRRRRFCRRSSGRRGRGSGGWRRSRSGGWRGGWGCRRRWLGRRRGRLSRRRRSGRTCRKQARAHDKSNARQPGSAGQRRDIEVSIVFVSHDVFTDLWVARLAVSWAARHVPSSDPLRVAHGLEQAHDLDCLRDRHRADVALRELDDARRRLTKDGVPISERHECLVHAVGAIDR